MEDVGEWVRATKDDIRRLGGSFMKSPEARQAAQKLQLHGYAHYFGGRSGVLGPAGPEVVAAVFGFFPAQFVARHHRAAPTPEAARGAALGYVRCAHRWGRRCLAGFEGAERLAELLEYAVDRAEAPGLALFAGWRALPLPDDAPARVAQLAHVLREHRGGRHLTAVLAAGLSPVEAVLTRDNGPARAAFLGWRPPHPPLNAHTYARRAAAEDLTDTLTTPAYTALTPVQRDELARLLHTATALALTRHRATTTARQPAAR